MAFDIWPKNREPVSAIVTAVVVFVIVASVLQPRAPGRESINDHLSSEPDDDYF